MLTRRMPLRASANFCRRIGTGYRSGVDLLRLFASETKHGSARQKFAMSSVYGAIRGGSPIHEAMRAQSNFFPPLLIAMTHAGEITGKLDRTLLILADYYDERVKIHREFIGRIAWPVLQLFAAINVIALLIYLLGILQPMTGGEMFDPTGFGLRGASGALRFYGYVLAVALFLVAVLIAFQKNFAGVHNLVPLLYRIPVAGPALQTITLARFCWTLALSLDAGSDPIRAIQLGLDATDSEFYRTAKDDVERSIRSGKTMSEALLATGVFPDDFITHVEVAELSGTDAEALQHLAADYDLRARAAMKTLAGLASGVVWVSVVVLMVFMILRMVFRITGGINEALQPI